MEKLTQEQLQRYYHSHPIINFLGIEVAAKDDGSVRLELPVDEIHTNLYGIAHGGVLTTMADTAMGAVCLAKNKKVVTVSMTIDFLHSVPLTKRVAAEARILHDGRQTMVCECDIIDDDGKLFARVLATFFVIGKFADDEFSN